MNVRARAQLALREAEIALAQEVGPAVTKLGDELVERVRSKMREDTGQGKRRVKKKVTGTGFRKRLSIIGDSPQAFVEEYGRKPGGKLPPFKRGSALFKWVGRKGLANSSRGLAKLAVYKRDLFNKRISEKTIERRATRAANRAQETIAYLVARKIARDGIPARKPFERTRRESEGFIRDTIDAAIDRAVERLNA